MPGLRALNNVIEIAFNLKRHGPSVAFNFYCKIMLFGISYNYLATPTTVSKTSPGRYVHRVSALTASIFNP